LRLSVESFKNDKKAHHNSEDSSRGRDNGEPSNEGPDTVILGKKSGGLSVLVESESVTHGRRLDHNSSSVHEVDLEVLGTG
jgi:hypothetical protein